MSRFNKYVGLALLVGIVAALGISSIASAQSSVTPTPAAPDTATVPAVPRGGFGFGRGGLHSQAALEAAAKALGMTTDELSAQLWGGKTLADIADAQGVDIADVQQAVQAAMVEETKTAIEQAVTDGTITQAKADWLIEGLDKGYWGAGQDDFGPGFGMGHGGRGMAPGFGGPNGMAPNGAAPNSDNNGNNNSSTTPSRFSF
jgi:hypothetical protein